MKLTTYVHPAHGSIPVAGVLQGDRIVNVGALLGLAPSLTMLDLLGLGPQQLEHLSKAADEFAMAHQSAVHIPRESVVPAWESRIIAPLPDPPSIRDFYAFEQHVGAGYRKRGRDIPPAWFEVPVFYFGHTGNIYGPGAEIPKPAETGELDFELELAAVIGTAGRDIPPGSAWAHIAGFTIMNDWSARDLQRQELAVGLGPAKGKDFATSFGPVIVTLDELQHAIDGNVIELRMTARVNDEVVSTDTSASMHWGFPALIARASRNVDLRPGDIVGSGTCGSGCILELGPEIVPWLVPGDEVELEIDHIGRLRSTIA